MPLPTMMRGSGTVRGVYRLGSYTCMLISDAESPGPIKYVYMLAVMGPEPKSTALTVTLETNDMQAELLRSAGEHMDEDTRKGLLENAPAAYLCVFAKDGAHYILEHLDRVPSIEEFRGKAFAIASERLGVANSPTQLEGPKPEGSSAPGWLIGVAAVGLAVILLFPPYTQHFLAGRDRELSGHGGWKFLFDIGTLNNRIRTESINVGLLLFEIVLLVSIAGILWWATRRR